VPAGSCEDPCVTRLPLGERDGLCGGLAAEIVLDRPADRFALESTRAERFFRSLGE
jgi:hypothetical protein